MSTGICWLPGEPAYQYLYPWKHCKGSFPYRQDGLRFSFGCVIVQFMKTQDAIRHFKTPSALAAALRIKRQAIPQWGERVPKLRAYELERLTGGALKMRPEMYQ